MNIKTMDGVTEDVSSSGKGSLGVTLGAIGTGLGLLNGGLGLFGNGNGVVGRGVAGGDAVVTRHELDLVQQIQAKDILLAQKDAQLALKESESYTDQKMVEVYAALKASENQLRDEVRTNKDQQAIINAQQMAWNATATGTFGTMQAQIAALQSITTNVVPQNKVCDTGCCCNN